MSIRIFAIVFMSCFGVIAANARERDNAGASHPHSPRMSRVTHSSSARNSSSDDDESRTSARSKKSRAHAASKKGKHHSDIRSSKQSKRGARRANLDNSDEPPIFDLNTPVDLPSHNDENAQDGLQDETENDDTASGNLIPMEDQGGGGGG